MEHAPSPGRKIPSWKSTSQCQFNFTLGAIKPFSNHLVLLAASAVNSGDVIYSLDITQGGNQVRTLKELPSVPPQRPRETDCAQLGTLDREVGVLAATVTSSPPTQAGGAPDGPIWGGKTEAGRLSPLPPLDPYHPTALITGDNKENT